MGFSKDEFKQELTRGAKTVGQLIEELEEYDADAQIVFLCDYGDRGHTMQALPVVTTDEYDVSNFEQSCYSQSGISFNEETTGKEGVVVVLSAQRHF